MTSKLPLLAFVATAALACGACKSAEGQRTNLRAGGHWNPVSASESISYAFLGANSNTTYTIDQTGEASGESIALTMRRHFLNDNPYNPLQSHPYEPGDEYRLITDGPKNSAVEIWDGARTLGNHVVDGGRAAVLLPVQIFGGSRFVTSADFEPPKPDEFRVKNKR